jgi:hypothetical protein
MTLIGLLGCNSAEELAPTSALRAAHARRGGGGDNSVSAARKRKRQYQATFSSRRIESPLERIEEISHRTTSGDAKPDSLTERQRRCGTKTKIFCDVRVLARRYG